MDGQQTQQPETWGQKQWDRSAGIRHAALAAGVGRLQKVAGLNARLVRKMQNGTLGTPTEEPEDEEDDSVHVGDITYNLVQPPSPSSAIQHRDPPPTIVPLKQIGIWPWVAMTSAALLGGGGIGAGIAQYFRSLPAVPAVSTDMDTQYQLRLVEPEGKGQ